MPRCAQLGIASPLNLPAADLGHAEDQDESPGCPPRSRLPIDRIAV